ncbi:MAG: DAK2 domain-containing protein [Deltaproteobacteria bacterium]|nr:DAK2 domain-containing protein [Deltaproteobacteria bacterium]
MTSATSSETSESIGPEGLREALATGTECLRRHQRLLDNLNVFPVPDGDTGANMVATLQACLKALGDAPVPSMACLADCVCDELLRASRGNSGFIVAWFFSGFLGTAGRYDRLTGDGLIEGFAQGDYQARSSLVLPVEGTMLTVISAMASALRECSGLAPAACLKQALVAGRRSLFETPRMLPILAKAGVVDAGALGFVFLVEGMLCGLTRESLPCEREETYRFRPDPRALLEWTPAPEYRYCTEVLVESPQFPEDPTLQPFLEARGNSIALVANRRLLKLHIHTNDPQAVLERIAEQGPIVSSKVEDMHRQVDAAAARAIADARDAGRARASVLACIPGPGFDRVFRDLGAARCLLYGRTLPTAGALLDALTEMDAPSVLLLPNNGNLVPAATLARDLSGRDVVVIPTRNVVEGIAATYGYSENDPIDENARHMGDCIGLAECLCLYRAVQASAFGDCSIPEGAWFAMRGDTLLSVRDDPVSAVLEALEAAGAAGRSDLTLFTGEDFDEAILPAIRTGIARMNPGLEIGVHRGGQPRELLILSLE